MADLYAEILDECLSLVLQGAPIDECVRRFPEHGAQLEIDLTMAMQVADAASFEPSNAAKALSRQRLEAELRQIQVAEWQRSGGQSAGGAWFKSLFGQVSPRWASAVAAVAVLAFGGLGTVSASSSSLPGDTLYPVKRVAEETRVTLSFSEQRKAELELAHARRRAEEANALLRQGRTEPIAIAQVAMQRHFDRAATRAAALEEDKGGREVRTQVHQDVSGVLDFLQDVARTGPEPMRLRAQQLYDEASRRLAATSESLAAERHPEAASTGEGTIQFVATDLVDVDADQVLATFSRIDVLRAGPGGGWIALLAEPRTVDLLQAEDVQEFLGEFDVEAGLYTRVRFAISSVVIVKGDAAVPASLPGRRVTIDRPFRVDPGVATVVLLDLGGERSLRVSGDDEYRFSPSNRIYALEPGQEAKRSAKRQEDREDHDRKERDQAKEPKDREKGRKEVEDNERRVRIRGVIEEVGRDAIVIDGRRIEIEDMSHVPDHLVKGKQVIIDVPSDRRGQFGKGRIVDVRDAPPSAPPQRARPPRREVPEPPEAAERVRFTGVIQRMGEGVWVVGGRRVAITHETRVEGEAAIGVEVLVVGVSRSDEVVQALRIVVRSPRVGNRDASPIEPQADRRNGRSRGRSSGV